MDSWSEILDDVLTRGADLAVRTAAAIAVGLVIVGVGMLLRPLVRRRLERHGRPSRTRVFTALFSLLVGGVGVADGMAPRSRPAGALPWRDGLHARPAWTRS